MIHFNFNNMNYKLIALLAVPFLITSCVDSSPSTDDLDRVKQEKILREGQRQTGLPNITNFTEKKLAITLMNLRDQQGVASYTYVTNATGLHFICDSVGFGLPYSTQITNPNKLESYSSYWAAPMPQAEPNGLFMPGSAAASWAICAVPGGGVSPVYVEGDLLVSPFKLNPTDSWAGIPKAVSVNK